MGLIKAAINSVAGTFEEQWKEYFSCEALPNTVMMKRGYKVVGGRASNNGNDNIISNGSKIIVYDGQAAIITDNGKIVDFVSEPGGYEFNKSSQPSIFYDKNIGENVKKSLLEAWERFKFSGQPSNEQKIFFFNMKEISGLKFGSSNGGSTATVCSRAHSEVRRSIVVKYYGDYRIKIVNPILFYKEVAGNNNQYETNILTTNYGADIVTKIQGAISELSASGNLYFDDVQGQTGNLGQKIDNIISADWINAYGIDINKLTITVTLSDTDRAAITKLEDQASGYDIEYGKAAQYTGNAKDAIMMKAAGNQGGSGEGMMGMMAAMMAQNMMNQQNGNQVQNNQQAQPQGIACPKCGAKNQNGKFCNECGQSLVAQEWTCECGAKNSGKFCSSCGKPKQ